VGPLEADRGLFRTAREPDPDVDRPVLRVAPEGHCSLTDLKHMKDDVNNRRRIRPGRKLRLAAIALRENGLIWCVLLVAYYVSSSVAHRTFAWMTLRRQRHGIPGLNSPTLNREIWDGWNWEAGGEEWSGSAQWMASLRRCVLEARIPMQSSVLEIGPGAGRWTVDLLPRACQYVGVDISDICIQKCRSRFRDANHARFMTGSGNDLADVESGSIDAIWSFDVFVHINRREFERYADEFVRVLRPGGIGVIHHGSIAGASGGWRSDVTAAAVQELLTRRGLRIEDSFGEWTDLGEVHRLSYDDLITVFRRPT
jgi:SAM-dependent methyltransferase